MVICWPAAPRVHTSPNLCWLPSSAPTPPRRPTTLSRRAPPRPLRATRRRLMPGGYENGTIETRGKTKLKDIWNLPKGLRIVVQCNDLNQAVGDEAGILSKFLGMNKGNMNQNDHMQQGKNNSNAYKKQQCNIVDIMDANSLEIGTNVFLKSWKNRNKNVVVASIVSCDPTRKVAGIELGTEYLMVHVHFPLAKYEELIRPYKGYKIIGNVVDKINGS
ncbi:hypothetical protein OsI_15406 [Oryza sativa Indica Group]|uniref:Transposase Tnp1/En/Spm-like domain-containing protein n=2 Tax=Oryza sativa TaxID=4530 RepID=B9FEI1_ORYSJ|nr:hypothetical protein OsI_15406 [Oryza sativa Indica Group]EEE60764.1 hypothetical protein OsJ_14327 [Oryza sativa Japonica Group]